MHRLLSASIALALATPFGALADTASEISALRQEIDTMRAAYEARLQALEQRLQRAEAAAAPAPVAAVAAVAGTPGAAASAVPVAARPEHLAIRHTRCRIRRRRECIQPLDVADPFGPVHAHVAGPRDLLDQRLPAAARRRDRAWHARLQPRGIRARLRRQHRPLAARRCQHRAAPRQHRLGRGGVHPDHLARQRHLVEGGPLLLGHRLSQPAAFAHLGFRRQPARLPGPARYAVRRRRRPTDLARAARLLRRARRRTWPRPQLSRYRHRTQRCGDGHAVRARRRRRRPPATAGAQPVGAEREGERSEPAGDKRRGQRG